MPVLGQGTWGMGEDFVKKPAEIRALRIGLDLGLNLIDTAGIYGEGGAEEMIGEAMLGAPGHAVTKGLACRSTRGRGSRPGKPATGVAPAPGRVSHRRRRRRPAPTAIPFLRPPALPRLC